MPEWIGKTIGKVRIEKLLAGGGMAEVYLGTHVTLARPVAVKLLHSFIEEEPLLFPVIAGFRGILASFGTFQSLREILLTSSPALPFPPFDVAQDKLSRVWWRLLFLLADKN